MVILSGTSHISSTIVILCICVIYIYDIIYVFLLVTSVYNFPVLVLSAKQLSSWGKEATNFVTQGCFIFRTKFHKALKQRNSD